MRVRALCGAAVGVSLLLTGAAGQKDYGHYIFEGSVLSGEYLENQFDTDINHLSMRPIGVLEPQKDVGHCGKESLNLERRTFAIARDVTSREPATQPTTESWTLSGFVRSMERNSAGPRAFFHMGSAWEDGPAGLGFHFGIDGDTDNDGFASLYITDHVTKLTVPYNMYMPTSLAVGQPWHHIVVRYDHTTTRTEVYINEAFVFETDVYQWNLNWLGCDVGPPTCPAKFGGFLIGARHRGTTNYMRSNDWLVDDVKLMHQVQNMLVLRGNCQGGPSARMIMTPPPPADGDTPLTVVESTGSQTLSIQLTTTPSSPVTVAVAVDKATEATIVPSQIVLTDTTAKQVVVTAVDDRWDDGDKPFTVSVDVTTTDRDYRYLQPPVILPSTVSFMNQDDDTSDVVLQWFGSETSEDGVRVVRCVARLASRPFVIDPATQQPTGVGVTVTAVVDDTTEANVVTLADPPGAAAYFAADQWDGFQTITITGIDDFVDDGDHTFEVTLSWTSDDPKYTSTAATRVVKSLKNVDDDRAWVQVNDDAAQGVGGTTEAGAAVTLSVVLTSEPTGAVYVDIATEDATEGAVQGSLTFGPQNWNVAQALVVRGVDDALDDGDITYTVAVDPSRADDPVYAALPIPQHSITNYDDDVAGVEYATTDLATREALAGTSSAGVIFAVMLATEPTAPVDVTFTSSDASEAQPVVATLRFVSTTWNLAQTVTITAVNDDVDDGDQPYVISVATSSNDVKYANIPLPDVAGVNLDDDTAGMTVSPASLTVSEEGPSVEMYTVQLDSEPVTSVTVSIADSRGAAPEIALSAMALTFTPGNWGSPQTVSVTARDDDVIDGTLSSDLTHTAGGGGDATYEGLEAVITVAAEDNDVAGVVCTPTTGLTTQEENGGTDTFVIVLTAEPREPVSIDFASSTPAEGATTVPSVVFTSATWNVAQTITLRGTDDDVDDGDQSYRITPEVRTMDPDFAAPGMPVDTVAAVNVDDDTAGLVVSPTMLITTEGDPASGASTDILVSLQSQPLASVVVALAVSDPAEAELSPRTLFFNEATWNIPQTVQVAGVDDVSKDGDQDFTVDIAIDAVATADALYRGLPPHPAVVGVNRDNDVAEVVIVSPPAPVQTTEAGGGPALTATVRLTSKPTGDVVIQFTPDNAEVTVEPASVVISPAAWNVESTIRIVGRDDDEDDGDRAWTVAGAASSDDGNYDAADVDAVMGVNIDDDSAGVAVVPGDTMMLPITLEEKAEQGMAGYVEVIRVSLESQPRARVRIPVATSDPTEGIVDPAILEFTPANWREPQAVRARRMDDAEADGDVAWTVEIRPPVSIDDVYAAIDPDDMPMVTLDDDIPGVDVNPATGQSTSESGLTAIFTVVLSSRPAADVTLTFASSNVDEGVLTGTTTLTFTSGGWKTRQTLTVSGVDDNVADGPVAYRIESTITTADPQYRDPMVVAPPTVALTNSDNDEAGVTVTPTAGLRTTEAGGAAEFIVVLNSAPREAVTITVDAAAGAGEGALAGAGALTFDAGNWGTPVTVVVEGIDDPYADGDAEYSIGLTINSADADYSVIDVDRVAVVNEDDDTAAIDVTPDPTGNVVALDEAGTLSSTFVYTLRAAPRPGTRVILEFANSRPDEVAVTPGAARFEFDETTWETPQTLTLAGVDDAIADGDQAFTVAPRVAAGDPAFRVVAPAVIGGAVADDEVAGFAVDPLVDIVTDELGGSALLTVRLASGPAENVIIPVRASGNGEVRVRPASVLFTPTNWMAPQTVDITGEDDKVQDGDIPYDVVVGPSLSGSDVYDQLPAVTVRGVNKDDDVAGVVATPSAVPIDTAEDGSAMGQVVVTLTSQPREPVTITASVSDASEVRVSPTFVVFTAVTWATPKQFAVAGVDDDVDDGAVDYTIAMAVESADALYAGMQISDVAGVNADDDDAGFDVQPPPVAGTPTLFVAESGSTTVVQVRLTAQPEADVRIRLQVDPTAAGIECDVTPTSVDLTSANWREYQKFTLTGVDDAVVDGDQLFEVAVVVETVDAVYAAASPPEAFTVMNRDDDTAGVSASLKAVVTSEDLMAEAFEVNLLSEPRQPVTLQATSSDPQEATVSPAEVVVAPADWAVPVIFTVLGVDDDVVDGEQQYAIDVASVSDDPAYASGTPTAAWAPPTLVGRNADNDIAEILVQNAVNLVTSEDGGTAEYTMLLAAAPASGTVVIPLVTGSPEVSVSVAAITFTPGTWDAVQTITVTGVDDPTEDGDKTWAISHGPAVHVGGAYAGKLAPDAEGTNADDDEAGVAVIPQPGVLRTTEAAGTGAAVRVIVQLLSRPTSPVTVTLRSSIPTEGAPDQSALVFTPDAWDSVVTVTITGVDDRRVDGDSIYALRTTPVLSLDGRYNGIDPDDIEGIVNVDDDVAGIDVTPPSAGGVTSEDGGVSFFEVKLTSSPASRVLLSLVSSNEREGVAHPATVAFAPDDWETARRVEIHGMDDRKVDGDTAYSISIEIDTTDAVYEGLNASAVPSFDLVNTDNDEGGVQITPGSPPPFALDEAGTRVVRVSVVLTAEPTADVSMPITLSNTEALASLASVDFDSTNWATPLVLELTGFDDSVVDGAVGFEVAFGSLVSDDLDFNGKPGTVLEGVVADNDNPRVDVIPTELTIDADGGVAVFEIVLSSQPTGDVVIAIASSNPAKGTVDTDLVMFTAATWNVSRAITVTGERDGKFDADVVFEIELSMMPATRDTIYAAIDPLDVTVTSLNVDTRAPTPAPGSGGGAAGNNTTPLSPASRIPAVLQINPVTDVTAQAITDDGGLELRLEVDHPGMSAFSGDLVGALEVAIEWPGGSKVFGSGAGKQCERQVTCVVLMTDVAPDAQPTGVAGRALAATGAFITAVAGADGHITIRLQDSAFYNPRAEQLSLQVSPAFYPRDTRVALERTAACLGDMCTVETTLVGSQLEYTTQETVEAIQDVVAPTTIVAASTVAVLGGSVSPSSIGNMARLAVLTKLCPETGSINLDMTLNPLGLRLGTAKRTEQVNGAVVGSIMMQAGLILISVLVAALIRRTLVSRRQEMLKGSAGFGVMKSESERTAVVRQHLSRKDWIYVMARARFGWILLPMTFMYGGTALACVCAVIYSEPMYKIMALVDGAVFLLGLPAYTLYVAQTAPKHGTVEEVDGNDTRPLMYKFFWGTQEWVARDRKGTPAWIELNRLFYDGYHMRARYFMVGETFVALIIGAISAWSPPEEDSCYIKAYATACVLFLWFCVMVGLRPYLAPYENILETAIVGLEVVMMGLTIVAYGEANPSKHWSFKYAGNLSLCVVWLITAKGLMDLTVFVIDEYGVWKEMKAAAAASHGKIPHPRPFIIHLLCCGNNIQGQQLEDHVYDERLDDKYHYKKRISQAYLPCEMDVVRVTTAGVGNGSGGSAGVFVSNRSNRSSPNSLDESREDVRSVTSWRNGMKGMSVSLHRQQSGSNENSPSQGSATGNVNAGQIASPMAPSSGPGAIVSPIGFPLSSSAKNLYPGRNTRARGATSLGTSYPSSPPNRTGGRGEGLRNKSPYRNATTGAGVGTSSMMLMDTSNPSLPAFALSSPATPVSAPALVPSRQNSTGPPGALKMNFI